ncbi:hypothetical protein GGI42DRAFT_289909 [Trichoderma sp. SZMC 28013]
MEIRRGWMTASLLARARALPAAGWLQRGEGRYVRMCVLVQVRYDCVLGGTKSWPTMELTGCIPGCTPTPTPTAVSTAAPHRTLWINGCSAWRVAAVEYVRL